MFVFADCAIYAAKGWGLISEVKIPVQELGGQREEGAHFREIWIVMFTVVGSILDGNFYMDM